MNRDRIDHLLDFYREDPQDPFNIYGLALEYSKFDRETALTYFLRLTHEFPDYLATYYQLGALYVDLNQIEKAIEIYEIGLKIASAAGNKRTFAELEAAKSNILED